MLQPKRVKYRRPHIIKYEGLSKVVTKFPSVNMAYKQSKVHGLVIVKSKLAVLSSHVTPKEVENLGLEFSHT